MILVFKIMVLGVLVSPLAATQAKVDLRPPREVLPGHWKDQAGHMHYYFEKAQVTMVDRDRLIGTYPFEIIKESRSENLIEIKLEAPDAGLRTIRIDFKRKGFMETFQLKGVTINNIMLYVDDKQSPGK